MTTSFIEIDISESTEMFTDFLVCNHIHIIKIDRVLVKLLMSDISKQNATLTLRAAR